MRKPLIYTVSVCLLGMPAFANEEAVTIRGLNLNSTPEEVEALMGECNPHEGEDTDGEFSCGDHKFSGYSVNEGKQIASISFHCSQINGCDYSIENVADMLLDSLSLEFSRKNSGVTITMNAPSGEAVSVIDLEESGMYVIISENNFRKPELRLD